MRLPRGQHIPIVLFSAYSNYEIEERATATDMSAQKLSLKTLSMLEKLRRERQQNSLL